MKHEEIIVLVGLIVIVCFLIWGWRNGAFSDQIVTMYEKVCTQYSAPSPIGKNDFDRFKGITTEVTCENWSQIKIN